MDKLKAFETFAAVAARGSLSAAARAEGVAPAVIGRRLDALEQHLGVKLLVRTTRRLALTPEGTAFLDDCQRILHEVASAESSVSAGGVQASGHLRVTAPAGFGRRHIAPLVPPFHAEHPRLRISLNLSDRIVDLAAEGYDCAVRVGDLPDSSWISIRLADNRRLAVAAPAYLRRRGVPRHPRELARHDCLVLSSDASQSRGWAFRVPRIAHGQDYERPLAGAGVPYAAAGRDPERAASSAGDAGHEVIHLRPGGPLDCSDGQVLHDWCLAGHGIAWRSTWEVEAEIAAGLLVPLLQAYAAPPNGVYALLPHPTRHLPLRVRLWVDYLKGYFGGPGFRGTASDP
ncbi:MAG TPA: LysR family transcriptional regulator [Ottowia sp.]|uniref:LysR family transcriptional regulator n=1 Tax=Ottowia sp. TaxID=1898956 RepID=UPI002CE461DF|nr:LysR family transcriptional regulator [Ottowia sp.]HMN22524.1 LysR family transcriptional regulator [Ottowia sp.]